MYWTKTLIPTMKETPEGAEIPSHVLMLRAGLVNQVMAGAYTYLPLGLRALKKAERIVREEMDAAGAVELAMPAISPRGLWERTGRVEAFGDVLVQLTLQRTGPQGPRRARAHARRDHHRPGLAADLQLSPDADHALPDHTEVPQRGAAAVRRAADQRVPDEGRLQLRRLRSSRSARATTRCTPPTAASSSRCGLDYLPVEAESGPIGGDASHEFMIPAENGEDAVLHCPYCGYAANQEKAEVGAPRLDTPPDVPLKPLAAGRHARREHDRAGQRVPEMPARQT